MMVVVSPHGSEGRWVWTSTGAAALSTPAAAKESRARPGAPSGLSSRLCCFVNLAGGGGGGQGGTPGGGARAPVAWAGRAAVRSQASSVSVRVPNPDHRTSPPERSSAQPIKATSRAAPTPTTAVASGLQRLRARSQRRRSYPTGGCCAAFSGRGACRAAQALGDGARSGLDDLTCDGADGNAMLCAQRVQACADRHGQGPGNGTRHRLTREPAAPLLRAEQRGDHRPEFSDNRVVRREVRNQRSKPPLPGLLHQRERQCQYPETTSAPPPC